MTESVTDIIVSRSRSHDGLNKMMLWSLGLHGAMIVGLMFSPAVRNDPPRAVMSISLSGSEGPKTEGMTQAGASRPGNRRRLRKSVQLSRRPRNVRR